MSFIFYTSTYSARLYYIIQEGGANMHNKENFYYCFFELC